MARIEFTERELRNRLHIEVIAYPDKHGPNEGRIEFSGFVTHTALSELRLDPVDQAVVRSENRAPEDLLLALEIIFRRYREQHPEKT